MSLILNYNCPTSSAGVPTALRKYSKFLVAATLTLVFAGSLVTSSGSGLSVPDWPTTYGHFMFAFPLSDMVGGIFYEHGHRMIASMVGFMTMALVVWALLCEKRAWVKKLCFFCLGAVICQGLLGGLTVLFYLPTAVSVGHAVLGQIFFVLTLMVAYVLSRERRVRELAGQTQTVSEPLLKAAVFLLAVVFVQLFLGALMRHTDSGLAVYDFPRMAGAWLPTLGDTMVKTINSWRFDVGLDPIKLSQVVVHLIHRFWAVVVFAAVLMVVYNTSRYCRDNEKVIINVFLIVLLTVVQIVLGAYTVLSRKATLVASSHVLVGAALLGFSVLLVLRLMPLTFKVRHSEPQAKNPLLMLKMEA